MFVQVILAFIINLVVILVAMPKYIQYLKGINYHQVVNVYSLDEFKEKAKTPIMGGVLFVLLPILTTIILDYHSIFNMKSMIVMVSFLGYGLIGFIDDYIIVIKKDNQGLKPIYKLLFQIVLAIVFYVLYRNHASSVITIPLIGVGINLGIFYSVFVFIMFASESNAVNFTDGMDGLAAGCSFISIVPFLVFAYLAKEYHLAILLSGVLGALLAYLYYNKKPAQIFMGDTGSLALGALLAASAMVLKKELLLLIIGGVFLWEMLCVVLQLSSVKLFKKRIFRYTPIHYAFVLGGMKEEYVVRNFWLLNALLALLGLIVGLLG
ncbi:phospho-N-acetylmuramoyl-pentapeptide-transferase [Erysipelotrichaceae bacterium OH741_COT-311]|nr:phospho-N-acetylmuramoyl-pentapeptide-transferase [Erysipelotrichaceae bacterium OH741_COT-311]